MFLESFQNMLDVFLFSPTTPTEYWVTLGLGLLAMLFMLFQTQSYFGAGQVNLPTALMSLIMGLGIMILGAVAVKCYVFSLLPQDWISNAQQMLTSVIGENILSESAMENIILVIVALALLFAAVCPITAGFCRSSQFTAGWSWFFALVVGLSTFFLVHVAFVHGKQTVESTDALQQFETQQKKDFLDKEKL